LPKHRPSLHSPAPDGLRRAGRAGGGGTIEQPPQLPWPLRYFVDEGGHETGFAMLRGTVGPGAVGAFDQMAATRRMIGFTHLGPFPLLHEGYGSGIAPGQDPEEGWCGPAVRSCEAWAHCFREPDRYLPPDRPRMLMSGSDFVDDEQVWSTGCPDGPPPKRWDVVYSCLPNGFNDTQKNWSLARVCALKMASELDLRILLVGRADAPDVPDHPNIDVTPMLPWSELMQCTARSRLAFLPNVMDASPRVITEALALDVPVLVNRAILGGWKYVEEDTGRFFGDEHDVVAATEECLTARFHPRETLLRTYGKHRSARRLASELRALDGGQSPETAELSYALPADTVAR
jgi:hypothetical protein